MINHLVQYKNKLIRGSAAPRKTPPNASAGTPKDAEEKDLALSVDQSLYVVFDTELTGLDSRKDSIVSLGAVRMNGSSIDLGDHFYRVVAPETKLTEQSVVIHGITPSEAAECPAIEVLLPEFLNFCGNNIVVGHFVSIDLKFINREMNRLYGTALKNHAVDTLRVYQWIKAREERFCAYHGGDAEDTSLFALSKKYGIPVSGAHNSLSDAFATAQLFQRFIPILAGLGIRSLKDLIRIGRP